MQLEISTCNPVSFTHLTHRCHFIKRRQIVLEKRPARMSRSFDICSSMFSTMGGISVELSQTPSCILVFHLKRCPRKSLPLRPHYASIIMNPCPRFVVSVHERRSAGARSISSQLRVDSVIEQTSSPSADVHSFLCISSRPKNALGNVTSHCSHKKSLP